MLHHVNKLSISCELQLDFCAEFYNTKPVMSNFFCIYKKPGKEPKQNPTQGVILNSIYTERFKSQTESSSLWCLLGSPQSLTLPADPGVLPCVGQCCSTSRSIREGNTGPKTTTLKAESGFTAEAGCV